MTFSKLILMVGPLPWVNAHIAYCLQCESASRHFQHGQGHTVIVITDGSFAALLATAPRLPTNTLNEPNPTPPESQVSSTFYRKQPSKH